jgi:HAD superfamily hydrolase (TIGR01509 family)
MSLATTIQLIVFDLGGVMIRLARDWEHACTLAGVAYRPTVISPTQAASFHALDSRFNTGTITLDDFYAQLCGVFPGQYTADEWARIYQAIIREEFPGIHDLVLALRLAGYRTACLSNTCSPHWADLTNPARYPGIGALDYQHASHLFGVAKPDPRIYRCFEAATGFAPETTLCFDDRADNVLAARAGGWHAVQITDASLPTEQMRAALRHYAG